MTVNTCELYVRDVYPSMTGIALIRLDFRGASVKERARDSRSVRAITLDPAPLFRATGSNADNLVAGASFPLRVCEIVLP